MKIGLKLIVGFLVIAIIGGIIGYLGFSGSQSIFETYDVIAHETAPELVALGKIAASAEELQVGAVGFALIQSELEEGAAAAELSELDEASEELDEAIEELEEVQEIGEEGEAEAEFIENIKEEKTKLHNAALALVTAKQEGKSGQEILDLKEELEEAEEEFRELIDARIAQETEEVKERDKFAEDLATSTTNLILITSVVGVLLALALGLFISRSISNTVTKLRDAANEIAKGNFDVEIPMRGDDEIRDLANRLDKMRQSVKSVMQAYEKRERQKRKK